MIDKIDFVYEILEELDNWKITFELANWDFCKDERIDLLIKKNYQNMLSGYEIIIDDFFKKNGELLENFVIRNEIKCQTLLDKIKNAISKEIYLIKYKDQILYYGKIIDKEKYQETIYGICK